MPAEALEPRLLMSRDLSVDMSSAMNDSDGNPFRSRMTAAVQAASVPEVQVSGYRIDIANGETTPSTIDYTDFGSVTQGGSAITKLYEIRNLGTATLTLGSASVPDGYSIYMNLPSALAAGATTYLGVRLNTATVGTYSGDISFATNDSDENPFHFRITGTVQAPAPQIHVSGNDHAIAEGDTNPSSSNGTDFGGVLRGSTALSRTFVVTNTGNAALTLGSVSVPAGYSITQNLPSFLAPGGSANLVVQLDTATVGTYAGDISFATNDFDENPFNFRITGIVQAAPAPEIQVTGNVTVFGGINIANGDTTPSPFDGTDFGSGEGGGGGGVFIYKTFEVHNLGTAILTLGSVSVPAGYSITQNLPSFLASGGSANLIVKMAITAATPHGTYAGDISFATNDSDESPFHFRVTCTVGTSLDPLIVVTTGSGNAIVDGDTTPSSSDGTYFGSVLLGSTALSRTFLVENNGNVGATLTLGTVTVPAGYTITQALPASIAAFSSAKLMVQLNTDSIGIYTGDISIATNDPNQNPFTFRITGTVEDITLSNNNIAENQPVGTVIGTFSTIDPHPGDSFGYSLVGGEGSEDNSSFEIVNNTLRTKASFDYTTRNSYSIRVQSIDSGGLQVDKVFTISVTDLDETAPSITAVTINDGAIQRSMVKKLAVSFSEPVSLSAGAITVRLSSGLAAPNTTITVTNPSGDEKTYLLTFSGSAVIGGSLPDGIYDLIVSASGVQDQTGNVMTGNYTQRFHRLFGDSDGNKIVNALDYARLKNTFARSSSDSLFNSAFDYEANNLINALDLARFRQRYGMSFSY